MATVDCALARLIALAEQSGPPASPIRMSPEEQRRRTALAREAVMAMEAIKNDPEEDDREFLQFLDESHPGGLNLERYYAGGPDRP